jgi:dipeptidyl aminopeptidase/acylaminoacyl peptidase
MATNYLHQGIYIVHGDADDNVPVREARRMREELGRFHRDFAWHEQPGAGHWWENSDEPGAECVDWPPLFEFFARHRIPADPEVRQIQFVTANPGISARSHWLGIDQQERALVPSTVSAQWDPGLQRVTATTDNVRRLILDTAPMQLPAGTALTVRLDGQELAATPTPPSRLESNPSNPGTTPWQQPVRFERIGDRWQIADALPAGHKHPGRSGPFKEAFRHRMLFVYGTHGTPEENAWALAKARFDAESFWYRGNGSVDVIPDTEFTLESTRDRGVILYGHRELNSAWPLLLGHSPIQVGRGEVRVGERRLVGEDLACLFLQPRPDSDVASVAVVAGSGLRGLRLTQRLPYFMAGTGYPDCLVLSPRFLEQGTKGIVTAGFFGPDWSISTGDWAWGSEE